MDQELRNILERLERSVGKLENGQAQTNNKLDRIDERFNAVDLNFVEVDKRFDTVDQQFGEVDKRFDAVDKQFGEVDKRFDAVDKQFGEVDKRFDAVDKQFGEVDKRFDTVDKRFDTVDGRLDKLETGQNELKDMIKHSTTLLTENLTNIRTDLRRKDTEMNADINLLFRRTEKNERDIEKIKGKLKI